MASLEELRKKLYGRKEPEERELSESIRGAARPGGQKPRTFWGGQGLEAFKKKSRPARPRGRWLVNVLIFTFVIFLGLAAYISYEIFFVREEVALTIAGPEGVELGESARFAIFIKNTGQVALSGVELNITYPEHTTALTPAGEPKEGLREKIVFERVAPGEEVKYEAVARFLGKTGDERTISALVIYRPENIQSRLTKKTTFTTRITRTPFVITVASPEEVARDQRINLSFNINSEAEAELKNLSFRVDYPSGFEFASAVPAPDFDDNIWSLGGIGSGEARKIEIRGSIRGQPEEVKSFNGVLGEFNPATKEWLVFLEEARGPRIASPFLFVRQDMNGRREGNVSGGERAQFTVFYKNNLPGPAKNVTITAKITEEALDFSTLRVVEGAYNPSGRMIIWNAASSPGLKEVGPGEEGKLSFSVNLRPSPPLRNLSDKNFTLVSAAEIDTLSPPEEFSGIKLRYQDRIEFKINTRLTLNTRVTYFDSPAPNSGPLPPKVRQETTYTVFWQLGNQSNDALNVEVKGGLPPNVRWIGTLGDAPGSAIFNSASGEVVWSIPRLSAGTGILRPQAALIFQVGLTPGEDQLGISPALVSNIKAEARDDFTGETLMADAEDVITELQTDTARNFEQWRVVP